MPESLRRALMLGLFLTPMLCGCLVPQPPGLGRQTIRIEPRNHRPYGLYLPKGYEDGQPTDASQRYPLLISLHGMRPFDDYGAHIRQWQQEADRYGFVVVAPRLLACDLAERYPIDDPDSGVLKRDEEAILAIMDEVFRVTNTDPNRVLLTSFSSGGYIAHFMLNRHPSRFASLAVFQSNFAAATLDTRQIPKYRDLPIAILTAENDFAPAKAGSKDAIDWYIRHGFTNLTAKTILGFGHQRTPEVAAVFFAERVQLEPKTPPPLGKIRTADAMPRSTWPPRAGGRNRRGAEAPLILDPRGRAVGGLRRGLFPDSPAGGGNGGRQSAGRTGRSVPLPPTRNGDDVRIIPLPAPVRRATRTPLPAPTRRARRPGQRTPPRAVPQRRPPPAGRPVARILVNSNIGLAPHLISFTADIPPELRRGADYLWMDQTGKNGKAEHICNKINGEKFLTEPGEHILSVLIITRDNQELRASTAITVLGPLGSR